MCGSNMYKVKFETPAPPDDPSTGWERLTWTDSDGREVSIKCNRRGITATEFVDELVQVLMLGVSYHPKSVDEALNQDNYTEREVGV